MDLIYLNGEHAGMQCPLTPPGISIGREVDNDLQLLIGGVSRYHAMISFDGVIWYIEDLGSTNGTIVCGQKITGKTRLNPEDEIQIGDQLFRFSAPVEVPPAEDNVQAAAAKTAVVNNSFLKNKPDLASQVRKARHSIFGGNPENKAPKERKKGGLGNVIYTLLVITLPLVCISGYMFWNTAKESKAKNAGSEVKEQPFFFYYERIVKSPDNVFRFEAKLENGVVVFTVDDLKYGRHNVVKQGNLKPAQVEALKDSIRQTGFMTLENQVTNTPIGPVEESRSIIVAVDGHFNKIVVRNTTAQTSFENVEKAIFDFAEVFDVRVDSMTEDEMREEAAQMFKRAQEMFANYQAAPKNLREAIIRFRNAKKYYEQFEPKPREWEICRKRLEEAEGLYKKIYQEMLFNIQKYRKLRQYDKASQECSKMLDFVEPDSADYQKFQRVKVEFDRMLRRRKK